MKRLLITGANGFVGRWLVRAARARGIHVVATTMPGNIAPAEWSEPGPGAVEVVHADFRDDEAVDQLTELHVDAVVHLAAIASGAEARLDPDTANVVNGAMTAFFADGFSRRPNPPRFLFISSGEVYGPDHNGPIAETSSRNPKSPYAISKAGAEIPLEMLWKQRKFPVIIARAFPHTGPGQTPTYVLPALARRLREAKKSGASTIAAGNLSVVRDFLDVRDVVEAYLLLLERGEPGQVYNVASGTGRRLSDCFATLAEIIGVDVKVDQDAALLRPGDIAALIGDATKLRATTGWLPQIPFEQTLKDLVDAQAD